jgi:hypothetical protein
VSRILFKFILVLGCLTSLNACSNNFVTWQEEVKLSDGRVITVTQKKHMEGAFAREAWLTINLPEFSSQPIVWHEHLQAMVLNVYAGHLYVVGIPPTQREYDEYGRQALPYIGFMWENGQWKRISISNIPEQIYDANMIPEGALQGYIEDLKSEHIGEASSINPKLVTVAQKSLSSRLGISPWGRHIDPQTTSQFN